MTAPYRSESEGLVAELTKAQRELDKMKSMARAARRRTLAIVGVIAACVASIAGVGWFAVEASYGGLGQSCHADATCDGRLVCVNVKPLFSSDLPRWTCQPPSAEPAAPTRFAPEFSVKCDHVVKTCGVSVEDYGAPEGWRGAIEGKAIVYTRITPSTVPTVGVGKIVNNGGMVSIAQQGGVTAGTVTISHTSNTITQQAP